MLTRIPPERHAAATPLFAGLEHQLIVRAVLAGAAPGAVYGDDPERPAAAFMRSPEGSFVGGDPAAAPFVAGLRDLLAAEPGRGAELVLFVSHPGWERALPAIVPGRPAVTIPRLHYTYRAEQGPPRATPPQGYQIVPIDAALLARADLRLPAHIHSWIANNWGDAAGFLARGFGAAALHGAEVASWSLADCVVDGRCEVGIHTAPAHRGRGVAVATAAAGVRAALARGLREVGWQCNEGNVGSWRTAERVGFARARGYAMYYFPPPDAAA